MFDDGLKMMILCYWCCPHDYFALVATSKIWSCAQSLRPAACFAVSRMHAPGCESSFAMEKWSSVWKECVAIFHVRNWPIVLWKESCIVQVGRYTFVPQLPFFKGVNDMVATHIAGESVASVLATSIEANSLGFRARVRSIDALLMLQSGRFAFLGALDCVNSAFDGTRFCEMLVNVVVSNSLQGLESEAMKFVATNTHVPHHLEEVPNYVKVMPWHVRKEKRKKSVLSEENSAPTGKLVIDFCDEGMGRGEGVIIASEELDFRIWNQKS